MCACGVCVQYQLGPTPALPPASRALCRAPSHPNPWSCCVTSREALKRRVRSRSPTKKKTAGSLGPGMGSAQSRYYPAPRKGDRSPVTVSSEQLTGTRRPSPGGQGRGQTDSPYGRPPGGGLVPALRRLREPIPRRKSGKKVAGTRGGN